jgi:hypothetical protein
MPLPPPRAPSVALAGQAQPHPESRFTSDVFALLRSEVEWNQIRRQVDVLDVAPSAPTVSVRNTRIVVRNS